MSNTTKIRDLLLLGVLVGSALAGQAVSAQGVSLELRTSDGRSEYRLGEPVPLELVFSSSSNQYVVRTSTSYPDLERETEEFRLSPSEGWSDPLEDYGQALRRRETDSEFNRLQVFAGPVSSARSGDEPVVVNLDLNRYVRFSKPGVYVLTIKDHRVSLKRTSSGEPNENLELVSKPLSLTIIAADTKWQADQLATALEEIKKRVTVGVNPCEVITSLDTRESEIAMVDALEDESQAVGCDFSFALLGARNRTFLLEHMQATLDSPQGMVTSQFVSTMASLTSLEDAGAKDFHGREAEARKTINEELVELLEEKRGAARAAAVSTLINESVQGSEEPGQGGQLLRLAAEVFEQLSSQAQNALLNTHWNDIKGSAMTPILRKCAEADKAMSCGNLQSELLLARLNEVSPADAAEVILADLGKENPRFPASVLALLPEKGLPELDGMLRARLESKTGNLDWTAELIRRYATTSLVGAVTSFLDENGPRTLGGSQLPNLVAYLCRAQPEVGEKKLREALAARDGTGWYRTLLEEVAKRNPAANIQGVAIEAMADAEHDVVWSAVKALTLTGDEQGKAALEKRLEQWHAKWMGREREISLTPWEEATTDDRNLGDALIQAIGTGAGWLLTEEDQRLLVQSALTENQRWQVSQYVLGAKTRPVAIVIFDTSPRNVHITLAQYNQESLEAAKRKLLQYPTGTVFLLEGVAQYGDEARKAVAELQAFLTEYGMRWEMREGT